MKQFTALASEIVKIRKYLGLWQHKNGSWYNITEVRPNAYTYTWYWSEKKRTFSAKDVFDVHSAKDRIKKTINHGYLLAQPQFPPETQVAEEKLKESYDEDWAPKKAYEKFNFKKFLQKL